MFMFIQFTKKYNHINSKGKTYQHYSSRTEVQDQIDAFFSENQSSQVPYIVFFQLMKLSYEVRFFHRLPPAYGSIF